ncbi:M4 family metallopeptidase [Sporosarcina sp. NPDC096371]|uniref:M4 family metallopeptidase n=1 Tax=Sporosarcina sp. NPDC096371 TaxID=3364530 RepID=UPI0038002459
MSKKVIIPAVLALSVAFGTTNVTTFAAPTGESTLLYKADGLSKQEVVKNFLQSQIALEASEKVRAAGGEQFKIISEEADRTTGTYHVRTIEQYKGIPIYGSGQAVALDANNNVYASFGEVTQTLGLSVIPTEASISQEDALATAKESIESKIGAVKNYDGIDAELTIYPYEGQYHLTYLVKASTSLPEPGYFHYFVDATSGEVINSFNAIHEADALASTPITGRGLDALGKMQTFSATKDAATGKNLLHGTIVSGSNTVGINTYDARRMGETGFILLSALLGFTGFEVETNTNFFADPAAVSAHTNSVKVNDYYQKIHKRNSLDDKGMTLVSTVHIGSKWNNAAWNGKQMLYGDGDGVQFSSLAGSMDVAGHEMTHGVITNTADLIYENESGAINESLADIFGVLSEMHSKGLSSPADWEIGEAVYTPYIDGDGGLRSLSNPRTKALHPAYGLRDNVYPDNYQDRYLGELDNGGVHINSSINNKAAYLISEGGEHYGVNVTGITRSKTEKIYYRALTLYLTPSSGFAEMRQAAIQAATDLYPDRNGAPSQETQTVMAAYDAVGVTGE